MFNLLIPAIFGVAILTSGISMNVRRVPSFLSAGVVRSKVHRRLEDPSKFKDQRGVRYVARVHDHRLYLLCVISVNLVSGSAVNRLRSATLGTLRLVTHANRLGRRRRIRRKVCNDFALTCPRDFSGSFVGSNDFARSSNFANLANRATR